MFPLTSSFCVGFVIPIPKNPLVGMKAIRVLAIPTELTPILEANVGYTGLALIGCASTVNAVTPKRLLPSP